MARAYTIVPEEIAKKKFGVQASLILSAMSAETPRTTAAITAAIVDKLITRQDPERVVAFYMTVWKKSGVVKLHEVSDPAGTVVAKPAAETMSSAESAFHPEVDQEDEATDDEPVGDDPVESLPALLPDLSGKKLSEACMAVITYRGGKATAPEVVETLNTNGYDFKINQVNSALQALQTKDLVKRDGEEFVAG